MKTILVVYSDRKMTKKELGYTKRYAFNTDADVEEGDMIKSIAYTTHILVVEVLDKAYKYFNRQTGKLTNTLDNSNLFEIKELKVIDKLDDNVVYGHKVE